MSQCGHSNRLKADVNETPLSKATTRCPKPWTIGPESYERFLNWTDQGAKNAKDSTKRSQAARSVAEKLGGKVLSAYVPTGPRVNAPFGILAWICITRTCCALQYVAVIVLREFHLQPAIPSITR